MNAIEYLIEHEKLKIHELAEKIGVSRMTIYKWTQGTKIRKVYREKLSELFSIDESYFTKDELLISEMLEIEKILLMNKQNEKHQKQKVILLQKEINQEELIEKIRELTIDANILFTYKVLTRVMESTRKGIEYDILKIILYAIQFDDDTSDAIKDAYIPGVIKKKQKEELYTLIHDFIIRKNYENKKDVNI